MISVYSEYENSVIEVFVALEFNAIYTTEDIGKSIERARQTEIAAKRMEQLNKEMGIKLREFLAGNQETSADIDSTVQGYYLAADIERRNELYKMNVETMRTAQLALQILEEEWGA